MKAGAEKTQFSAEFTGRITPRSEGVRVWKLDYHYTYLTTLQCVIGPSCGTAQREATLRQETLM